MTLPCLTQVFLLLLLVALPSCLALYKQQIVESEIVLSANKLLPKSIVPHHYKLELETHFSEGYFNGTVEIDITCQESTNTVVLHSHENLHIKNDDITVRSNATGENVPISSFSRNETADTLVIILANELHHGTTYTLHIAFNSNFSESHVGFFRGVDETSSGDERLYGVTVMYPSNARKVFPCFDEPSFKASFQISVAHSNSLVALSMMPLDHTEPATKEGWVWDTFAVSPPISTYAVGLVVSQLDSDAPINVPNKNGNLILQFHHKRNYTLPTRVNLTMITQQFIETIIEYFDVAYPFPKIDFVCLPGAIEHENSVGLLVGGKQYSEGGLQAIQTLGLHYFNQVSTPEGWTDFRILNLLSTYLFETTWWKMLLQKEFIFRLFSLNRFEFKYLKTYDTPSYSLIGGEWIFYMLNSSLTENTMRRALSRLVTPNNSETYNVESIWTALTEQGRADGTLVGSVNVSTIAKSWLQSKCQCFPVLTVTRNYEENTASLEQHIFFHEINRNTTQDEEETIWWLPIKYLTPQQLDPSNIHAVAWIGEKHLNVSNLPNSEYFIIVNPASSGYFLVNYDHHNWELISQYILNPNSYLPPETRVKLLNDAFLLAFGGQLSYAIPLNLSLSLYNETDAFMWFNLVRAVDFIRQRCIWSPIENKINGYIRLLMARMYDSVDITDDVVIGNLPYLEQAVAAEKRRVQNEMCLVGYQPCVNKLNEKLKKEMSTFQMYDNITDLHITCPEFLRSTSADWLQEFIKLLSFLKTTTYDESKVYAKNLGICPGYTDTVERILSYVFGNTVTITALHWSRIVRFLVESPVSHNISLNFFLQNFDRMNETSHEFAHEWPHFLNALFSRMTAYNSLEKLLEIQEHYGNRLSAVSIIHFNKALKEARDATAWHNKSAPDINNWIENVLPHFNITG